MADEECEEKPFPFLSLPAELRTKIYRACLDEDDDFHGLHSLWRPQPGLLRVSKQIRAETLPIYYGEGILVMSLHDIVNYPEDWKAFIKMKEGFTTGRTGQPGTSSLHHIKSLEVTYGDYYACPLGFRMDSSGRFCGFEEDYVELQWSRDWDWTGTDMGAVQDALTTIMTEAMGMEGFEKQSADLGQLLWFFGNECPQAARHTRIIF